jgi:PAS domain-containing protein
MSEQQYHTALYLAPIATSWLITLSLTVLAFRRRKVTGGIPFAISLALETLWISGYLLELVSPQLEDKIFWDNLQSIGAFFAPLGFLVFASEYSGRRSWKKWKLWAVLAMPGSIYILLAYTNSLHHLTMVNQRLIHEFPFDNYAYDFGLATYVVMIYSYILMLFAIHLLGKQYIRQTGFFRRQTGFVLAGLVIPVLGSLTIFINIPDLPQRDLSPYYFALADLFIAYGLFRSRLLNIVPVARDLIIEHMEDGILIVDPMGRLLDLNAAATKILGASAAITIGQPLTNLLPEGLALIGHDPDAKTIRKEIILHHLAVPEIIDLRITRLPNRHGNFSGYMLIMRDITMNKQREDMLHHAQDELEQRVSERTAALEAANQHLQTEAEHRTRSEQE